MPLLDILWRSLPQVIYNFLGTDVPEEVSFLLNLPWGDHRRHLREIHFCVFELRIENGDGGKRVARRGLKHLSVTGTMTHAEPTRKGQTRRQEPDTQGLWIPCRSAASPLASPACAFGPRWKVTFLATIFSSHTQAHQLPMPSHSTTSFSIMALITTVVIELCD